MPAITAIYHHAVLHGTATFEIEPPSQAEMEKRRRDIQAGGHPFVVALVDDEVAGYAYASRYRPRPAYAATVEDSVYVREECQGRGIGRALLTEVIALATARDFRQMIAVIGDSANFASITLHKRLGFVPVGSFRAVGFKFGRWLDTVLMQRALGSSASTSWTNAG